MIKVDGGTSVHRLVDTVKGRDIVDQVTKQLKKNKKLNRLSLLLSWFVG